MLMTQNGNFLLGRLYLTTDTESEQYAVKRGYKLCFKLTSNPFWLQRLYYFLLSAVEIVCYWKVLNRMKRPFDKTC